MAERKVPARKRTATNTRATTAEVYDNVVKSLEEQREIERKPAEILEEKRTRELVGEVTSLLERGVGDEIGKLKTEVGNFLDNLLEKLETEARQYASLKRAVAHKEEELREAYEIEKSACSLAALIEAQAQKEFEFEAAMTRRREELQTEIDDQRETWEKEKAAREAAGSEEQARTERERKRQKEEFDYSFKREQQQMREALTLEKERLERELAMKRETAEREFSERERIIAERESEIQELRTRVQKFPAELDDAVKKAAKEATDRIEFQAKSREEIMKREFAGEKNVLQTRINALEAVLKEQTERNVSLAQQVEKAYTQVQDVAVKAIDGSSNFKSYTSLQQLVAEQSRRQTAEK
jgi:hypothetical protein